MQVGAVVGPVVGEVIDISLAAVVVFNRAVRAATVSVDVLPVITLLPNINYAVSTPKNHRFLFIRFAYAINQ